MSVSTLLEVGDTVPVILQITDGNAGLYPQAEIRDDAANLLATLDLSHQAEGLYVPASPYSMPNEIFIKITYIVYTDIGHTTESDTYLRDIDVFLSVVPTDYKADVSSLETEIQYLSFDNMVVIDSINGVAGTAFPIGTHYQPSNNLTDALTICTNNNIDRLLLHTDLIIEATHDVSSMAIETHGVMGVDVTLNVGCTANNSVFRYLNLQGTVNNGDTLLVENCSILNLENFTGIMQAVTFIQGSEISIGTWAEIYNCRAGGEPGNEPEISVGNSQLNIQDYQGNLKLTDKTGDNRTTASFSAGNVTIADTCIAGKIQILGVGKVEADNSGVDCQVDIDAAITNEYIANYVWEHISANFILKVIKNKKVLAKNELVWELIIYDDDNTTPILNKAIKDKDGDDITDLEAGVLAQEVKTSV